MNRAHRRFALIVAGLLFGAFLSWSGSARAACTGSWSWSSDNGYSGTFAPGEPADLVAAYLSTWGGTLTAGPTLAGDGASFVFSAGHASVTEYTYTVIGSGCSEGGASAPAGSMGSYSQNAGLYVFVVGITLMFGIGVLTGMKR
ncbi:MAG: hypothetical protein ABI671_12100 [Burkholderiales bacterium]